jgi:pilus assembly protein Flp/PilA
MSAFMNGIKRFVNDEEGATAIEYALVAALISLVASTAMGPLGEAVSQKFTAVKNTLSPAAGGGASGG